MYSAVKLVAIAALALGSVTVASAQTDAQVAMARERTQNQVQVLDQRVKLNDGQRSNMREAILTFELASERAQASSDVEARRASMIKARAEMDRSAKTILKAAQYTTYMKMQDEREAKVNAR